MLTNTRMRIISSKLNFKLTLNNTKKLPIKSFVFRLKFSYKYNYQNKNLFYKSEAKNFSSEKLKLKERVQILESKDIIDEKEDWGEILALSLEKENTSRFNEHIKYIKSKNLVLSCSELNRVLSVVYNKNETVVDTIYNYIIEHNIKQDSISYNYFILSSLQFKSYHFAIDHVVEATIFNIPQNLSVIITLYKELYKLVNVEDRQKYLNVIDSHVKKFYSHDVIE